ncbi:MAG: DNA translocase FtsK 4TM domain-containing protein [Victivallales bacterium]|nr:DNA translocase FtsK 4TM domain-containing protein [Victivallales bacterium]
MNKESVEHDGGFRFRHALLITLALLLLLALFSHDAKDIQTLDGGVDAPLRNWIGPAGAHISRTLLFFFGVGTYPLLMFLIVCALRPLIPVPTHRRGYTGALAAVIVGTTVIFAMYPESFSAMTERLGIGHSMAPTSALSGGVLGQFVAAPENSPSPGILRHYIGAVGTLVVGSVFILTGLGFVWISDWHPVMKRLRDSKADRLVEAKDLDERTKTRERLRIEREERMNEASKAAEEKPESELNPETVNVKPPAGLRPSVQRRHKGAGSYQIPPVSLLSKPKETGSSDMDFVQVQKDILQTTLDSFGLDATVSGAVVGPRVTRYEITPEPGLKVERISTLSNNIAMDLQATSIRILAPIPGKNAVGVEVANPRSAAVCIRAMMDSESWTRSRAEIPVILGKNVSGDVVVTDLAKSPHLLIAGATGSGKSVCMNVLIMSLLYHFTPDELKLIMVDPKVVEFEVYKTIPHLITPIVNDPRKVPLALRWALNEMEQRYKILGCTGVRNLHSFNTRNPNGGPNVAPEGIDIPDKLPLVVILIDELADIMMIAKADVETSIARIAQKARAVGIHMVLATQTPRKDIITGVIKANLPSRIAFRVGSIVDSRVILDRKGAETLLGEGDMLFLPPGSADLDRVQGAWVSDSEIKGVVDFVSDQAEPEFFDGVIVEEGDEDGGDGDFVPDSGGVSVGVSAAKYIRPDDDTNVRQALDIILTERKASTSYIQRRLKIGYNKAADIMDILEKRGIIGPQPLTGGANREILVDDEN